MKEAVSRQGAKYAKGAKKKRLLWLYDSLWSCCLDFDFLTPIDIPYDRQGGKCVTPPLPGLPLRTFRP